MKKMGFALLAAVMLLSMLLPAAAMAQKYTVTYEYPVMLYKTSNNVSKKEAPVQETYESGTRVQIPMRLNGVYEGVDGRYYEIIDWEYRSDEDDVMTYMTEDKWGKRYLNFYMPEHDVTFGALIAERYVVEYLDLVGESQYIECTPGEAMPPYSISGYTPTMQGYAFVGWSEDGKNLVDIPATVKKSHVFTAVWKLWEQVLENKETVTVSTDKKNDNVWTPEKGKKGKGVEFHIEVEMSTFNPEKVYHNGKKLEHLRDFTYREGSTIVELTPEYLATVPEGRNDIEIGFVTVDEKGNEVTQMVTASFVVSTGAAADLPQTGDSSAFVLWLGALAAAAAVLLLRKRAAA